MDNSTETRENKVESKSDRRLMLAGLGLAGAAVLARVAKAGDLSPPPGPISPTGRSISQVYDRVAKGGDNASPEPRRCVQDCPSSASAMFVITQPGAYYLSSNIHAVPGLSCIEIQCDHVDLDGGGYTIVGTQGMRSAISNGSSSGVCRCVEIYDMSFRTCFGAADIDMDGCPDCFVSDCLFDQCVHPGSTVGPGCVCRLGATSEMCDCDVRDCSGSCVSVGQSSCVEDCTWGGGGGGGVLCADGCCVSCCNVSENAGVAFQLSDHCSLTDCEMRGVSGGVGAVCGAHCVVDKCVCLSSGGIFTGAQCTCTHLRVMECSGNGLTCGDQCTISECVWRQVSGPMCVCGDNCVVEDCDGAGGGAGGIACGVGACVSDCAMQGCQGTAISCGDNSCLTRCVARDSTTGMSTGRRCTCDDGYVSSCGQGISMDEDCDGVSCTVTSCTGTGMSMRRNGRVASCDIGHCDRGISMDSGVCVDGCVTCSCNDGYVCASDCRLTDCDAISCTNTGVTCLDRCSLTDMELRSCGGVSCSCGAGCCMDRCLCADGGSHAFVCTLDGDFTDCAVSRCNGWAMTCNGAMSVSCCRVVSCWGLDCPADSCITENELTSCDGGANSGLAGGAINCRGPRQTIADNCCMSCRVGIFIFGGCDGTVCESNEMTGCSVAGMVVSSTGCLCADNSCSARPPGSVGFDFGPCAFGPVVDCSTGGDVSLTNPTSSHHCTNWLF